jgi:oligosaccharyltransferase complex subunit delta (ribophorin II)
MNRMTKFIRAFIFVLSIAAVAVAAGSWTISDATLAVGPKGKEPTSSFTYFKVLQFQTDEINSFGASSQVEEILELSPTDTLRLTYTTKEGDKATRPHQSFILVEDPSTNLDIAIPVPVKPSGKAKLDLVRLKYHLS